MGRSIELHQWRTPSKREYDTPHGQLGEQVWPRLQIAFGPGPNWTNAGTSTGLPQDATPRNVTEFATGYETIATVEISLWGIETEAAEKCEDREPWVQGPQACAIALTTL